MLQDVAIEQGAKSFVVPRKLAGDNGAMIAMTGALMYQTTDFLSIAASHVKPRWRTDQVTVSWM